MYENINGAFCFKRLNATHEFGCTSSRSGNTGVLHILKEKNDFTWLIQDAKAVPYVVMLPFDFPDFTDTLLKLKDSGKVSGVILMSNRTSYSPDDVCPNRYSGLQESSCNDNGNKPWNSIGSSLLFIDFGFPILYLDSNEYPKDVEFLEQCFQKHNAHDLEFQTSRSLCAVELTSHMLAAVDSRTCIRRSSMINNLTPMRYCDPLLGLNIHLPLYPRIAGAVPPPKSKSVILVVTRLDGTSMFDGVVPGAGSPILGIVSLLTVAHILSTLVKDKPPKGKCTQF
ncbi:hypothetical protein RUM44_004683 [Polyplax serrata]|uniref:Nicastrin n=1 Tax=Polyplax serrata TaxID=468196 RepID=A0ABR1B3I3_POLSC